MKTKDVDIGDKKIKIKELSWNDQLTLVDEGYSARKLMQLCIVEPEANTLFDELTRDEGQKLFEVINEMNKLKEEKVGSDTDFQGTPKEEEPTK